MSISTEARLGAARQLMVAGKVAEARAINDALLVADPKHVGALIQRSRIESAADNYRLARDYTIEAYQLGPVLPRDHLNLLRRLRTFGLAERFHKAATSLPVELLSREQPLQLLASMFNTLDDPARALQYAEMGLSLNPEAIPLQLAKAQALMFLGRLEEDEQFLLECLRKKPGLAFAWWMLSRLRKQSPDSNHVAMLRRELAEARHPDDVTFLGYALHKELDDLGDTAGAYEALALANATRRKVVEYSPLLEHQLFSRLKSMPPAKPVPEENFGRHGQTPIFIVGMHRSGTSLMEQFLDGHPDIFCAGELYDFTRQMRYAADHHCPREVDIEIVEAAPELDFSEVGRGYLEAVQWRTSGQSHITDKLPTNFLNIGFILQALPHARVLHMVRSPLETCFSNLREFFSDTAALYSYEQSEMGDYYLQYASLMKHWHEAYPGRILDVSYTELITNSEATLRRIMEYCGLSYVPGMLDTSARSRSVSTASAVQVRSTPSLPPTPKWSLYEKQLGPLIERLTAAVPG